MNEPVATIWFDALSPVGRRVETGQTRRVAVRSRKGASVQWPVGKLHQPGYFLWKQNMTKLFRKQKQMQSTAVILSIKEMTVLHVSSMLLPLRRNFQTIAVGPQVASSFQM